MNKVPYLLIICIILVACQQPRSTELQTSATTQSHNQTQEIFRINCGDARTYSDRVGRVWIAEQAFSKGSWGYVGGGSVWRGVGDVSKTLADRVYNNERYGMKAWRFTIENGDYTLQLHFAETYDGAYRIGARTFNVSIEGVVVLEQFDIFAEAGAEFTAVIKEFPITVTDGVLDIEFYDLENNAMINGIVISKR